MELQYHPLHRISDLDMLMQWTLEHSIRYVPRRAGRCLETWRVAVLKLTKSIYFLNDAWVSVTVFIERNKHFDFMNNRNRLMADRQMSPEAAFNRALYTFNITNAHVSMIGYTAWITLPIWTCHCNELVASIQSVTYHVTLFTVQPFSWNTCF